ncbi:MAG TPA: LPXTG cell wall anchor domain-containing protein [Candidatus Saccharimonadia bacterium]
MSFIKLSVAAAALAATLVVPASASASTSSTNCLNGTDWQSYQGATTGNNPNLSRSANGTTGTGTIATKNGLPLCQTTTIVLESFTMPDTWDGQIWNETALPQYKYATTQFTIPAGVTNYTQTFSVAMPSGCKNAQLDFYVGDGYDKLTSLNADDNTWLAGHMFSGNANACATPKPTPTPTPKVTCTPSPKVTPTPTPTPTKTPVPVTTPTPTPSVLGTSTQLPDTGAEGLIGAFGLTAMVGTAGIYLKQRLNRK